MGRRRKNIDGTAWFLSQHLCYCWLPMQASSTWLSARSRQEQPLNWLMVQSYSARGKERTGKRLIYIAEAVGWCCLL